MKTIKQFGRGNCKAWVVEINGRQRVMAEDRLGCTQWPQLFEGRLYWDNPERVTIGAKRAAAQAFKFIAKQP